MQSHFSLFDLLPAFDIDLAELERRYFEAQRLFHPDRYAGKSAVERGRAIERSMRINEAYDVLKTPLRRVRHLLAIKGKEEPKPSHALLMEIMESREALADAADIGAINKLAGRNDTAKRETLAAFAPAFAEDRLDDAAALAVRLAYLLKIEEEIRIRKKTASAVRTN